MTKVVLKDLKNQSTNPCATAPTKSRCFLVTDVHSAHVPRMFPRHPCARENPQMKAWPIARQQQGTFMRLISLSVPV